MAATSARITTSVPMITEARDTPGSFRFRTLKIVDIDSALLRSGREVRRVAWQRRRAGRARVWARSGWRRRTRQRRRQRRDARREVRRLDGQRAQRARCAHRRGAGGNGDRRAGHVRRHLTRDGRGGHTRREAGTVRVRVRRDHVGRAVFAGRRTDRSSGREHGSGSPGRGRSRRAVACTSTASP